MRRRPGAAGGPAGHPRRRAARPTSPARVAPLDEVLDTYADLLVADGLHALVTGRADLANAAMEAAAGLGAPPDLRAIRTPREATTVRVSAWALLAPGDAPVVDPTPAQLADPAFAALAADVLGPDALESPDPALVEARGRLAAVLGGGDDDPPVPSLTGGDYEGVPAGGAADGALRAAMASDLGDRLIRLGTLAQAAHDELAALDPDAADADERITALAVRWTVDLTGVVPERSRRRGPVTRGPSRRVGDRAGRPHGRRPGRDRWPRRGGPRSAEPSRDA